MSQSVRPPKPIGTARPLAKPSLRWRIRRWILQRLDAWPRERPEPRTEWGRMRREERRRLVAEMQKLRAIEDRLVRYLDYVEEGDSDGYRRTFARDVHCFVIEGRLDEMLAEFAEDGDEVAAEYLRRGS